MLRRFALVSTLLLAGSAVGSTVFAGSAIAGTAAASLSVSAGVGAVCTISTTGINLGIYNPVSTSDTTATGNVSTNCNLSSGTPYVDLDKGANGATTLTRKLKNTTDNTSTLNYTLVDTNTNFNWGVGTPGASDAGVAVTANGSTTKAIKATITALQAAPSGTYSDTVTATVNF